MQAKWRVVALLTATMASVSVANAQPQPTATGAVPRRGNDAPNSPWLTANDWCEDWLTLCWNDWDGLRGVRPIVEMPTGQRFPVHGHWYMPKKPAPAIGFDANIYRGWLSWQAAYVMAFADEAAGRAAGWQTGPSILDGWFALGVGWMTSPLDSSFGAEQFPWKGDRYFFVSVNPVAAVRTAVRNPPEPSVPPTLCPEAGIEPERRPDVPPAPPPDAGVEAGDAAVDVEPIPPTPQTRVVAVHSYVVPAPGMMRDGEMIYESFPKDSKALRDERCKAVSTAGHWNAHLADSAGAFLTKNFGLAFVREYYVKESHEIRIAVVFPEGTVEEVLAALTDDGREAARRGATVQVAPVDDDQACLQRQDGEWVVTPQTLQRPRFERCLYPRQRPVPQGYRWGDCIDLDAPETEAR